MKIPIATLSLLPTHRASQALNLNETSGISIEEFLMDARLFRFTRISEPKKNADDQFARWKTLALLPHRAEVLTTGLSKSAGRAFAQS